MIIGILFIIAQPVIITDPQSSTIRQSTNAIFICQAQGYPLPTIIWQHNGENVTDNQSDYLITPSNNVSIMTTTSKLRIFFADVKKSGQVTCIASANAPMGSGITLASDHRSTSLTVLGKPNYLVLCIMIASVL